VTRGRLAPLPFFLLASVSSCPFVSLSPCLQVFSWHVYQLRLDGDAGTDLLQANDDHLLARLQAIINSPQSIMQRT
jgi:hypothetical protein